MILRRLGNKAKISKKIQEYFPPHKIYIEPFFGAGGMFFNKSKAKYNYVNDIDSDVYNLFMVLMNNEDKLKDLLEVMPIHQELFNYWKTNKENDPIKKAVRFLFLSNFSYLGHMDTLKFGLENTKQILLNNFAKTKEKLKNVQFANVDFRKFISQYSFKNDKEKNKTFIYADSPYISTSNNYSNSFKKQDSIDLFDVLCNSKIKFAYSEFNNEFIINEAKKRKLNIITIGERQSLKNRNVEILITNYKNNLTLF